MSEARSFADAVLGAIVEALDPLAAALSDATLLDDLLEQLGWEPPAAEYDVAPVAAYFSVGDLIARAVEQLARVREREPSAGDLAELAADVAAVLEAIADIAAAPVPSELPEPLDDAAFWSTLAAQLPDHLLAGQLERAKPLTYALLLVAGVIDERAVPADDERRRPDRRPLQLRWDRIGLFVARPAGIAETVYEWGVDFDHERLLARLERACGTAGLLARRVEPSRELIVAHYGEPAAAPADLRELRILLQAGHEPSGDVFEAGIGVLPIPPAPGADPAGLFAYPYAEGSLRRELDILPSLTGRLVGGADAAGRAGVRVLPGRADAVLAPGAPAAEVGVELAYEPAEPWLLAGGSSGTRARLGVAALRLGATAAEAIVALRFDRLEVTLDLAAAGPFIAAIAGRGEVVVTAGGVVEWSSRRGLGLAGGGLALSVPLHVRVLALELERLTLELAAADPGVELRAGVAGRMSLGPLEVTAEGLGGALVLQPGDGALGTADLRLDFSPPTGLGLRLTAGPVRGGGQLLVGHGFYAGDLTLAAEKFVLRAAGVLATETPEGGELPAPGWSLLAVISGEFPPIQIGMGFTLNGLGGVLGVHRTAAVPALQAAARSGTLGNLLFGGTGPDNALERVASLAELFPISVGRHVFGPTAKIAWGPGAATLLTIDVALLLELPAPLRLIVVGRVRMALPRPSDAIVAINMDVFGVIDFEAREASVDARLFDSQIAGFTLTGEMAMRLRWGEEPTFALSIGGFHPRFLPPAGFPDLRRLALSLAEKPNLRLRLEGYLALTTATVQFGARLELFARAGDFTVEGLLYFDALLQFAPRFGFMVDMGAAIAIKYRSWELLSVSLELSLAGTNPWHARGVARFRILFIEISGEFDEQWGSEELPPPPPPVNVGELLRDALKERSAWNVELPPATGGVVALRSGAKAVDGLLAHPLGTVAFRERVVPLGVPISRFGNATLAGGGGRAFVVKRVSYGTVTAAPRSSEPLYEQFALGDFVDLTDDQRLSGPAFVRWEAGRRFGLARGEARDHGSLATTPMVREYATKYGGEEDAAISRAVAARTAGAVASPDRERHAAPASGRRPTPSGLTIVVPERRYAAADVSGTYAEAVVAAGRAQRRVRVTTA